MRTWLTFTATLLALVLVGCSAPAAEPVSDPAPSQSAVQASPPIVAEPVDPVDEREDDRTSLKFGDVYTYTISTTGEEAASISVSEPVPFTPSEYAYGATFPTNLVFTVAVTNTGTDNLDLFAYSQVLSGGKEGSGVFDSGNPLGEILGPPSLLLQPGQSISWLEGWSVADPADISFQIAPSFDYATAIFSLK